MEKCEKLDAAAIGAETFAEKAFGSQFLGYGVKPYKPNASKERRPVKEIERASM